MPRSVSSAVKNCSAAPGLERNCVATAYITLPPGGSDVAALKAATTGEGEAA